MRKLESILTMVGGAVLPGALLGVTAWRWHVTPLGSLFDWILLWVSWLTVLASVSYALHNAGRRGGL